MAIRTHSPLVGTALVSLWRSLRRDLFDTYRPERHYMRGPGPAWRAKHVAVAPHATLANVGA
jgi:hypothetical protein